MESKMAQMNKSQLVYDFHKKFNSHVSSRPTLPDDSERTLRKSLLTEEYNEYLLGEKNNDIVEIADALGDMLYIIYGTAVSYGLPIDNIFQEIHDSNMSKLDKNGNPVYREDGKILKGDNYFKPDLKKIINDAMDINNPLTYL